MWRSPVLTPWLNLLRLRVEVFRPAAGVTTKPGGAAHTKGMTPYEVLGVPRNASPRAIRFAYRARMRWAHPDRGGSAGEAQRLNEAYAILSDPVRRASIAPERPASQPKPAATETTRRPAPRPRPAQSTPASSARREYARNSAPASSQQQSRPAARTATAPQPKVATAKVVVEQYERPSVPIREVSVLAGIALAVVMGALNGGVAGAVFPVTAAILLHFAWNRWTVPAALVYAAVPALIPAAVSGSLAFTDILHAAGAMLGMGTMLTLWALARRQNRKMAEHCASVFRKTRDEHHLQMHVVLDEGVTSQGARTLRLQTIGGTRWTMTPNADAPRAKRGDVILAHGGQPLLVLGEDERRYL